MPAEQEQTLTIQKAIELAVQHHEAGNLPKAESIYQQVLNADPNQPVALHLLGVIAYQVGKNEISIDLIKKAITIDPDYADAYSNLGNALQGLGNMDEAVKSYRKAITLKPDYAVSHSNLGSALKELGQLDGAMVSFNKALDINPHLVEAHSGLGNVLKVHGKLDEAVASYNKALIIKPDYAEAHSNLGLVLQELGQFHDAIASYNKALNIKPDFVEAHFNRGNAFKELGQLDKAVASYNRALAIKPNYAYAHSNLGIALKELGRFDEAIANYNKAISIKPDYAEAYNNMGIALKELEMLDEAVTSYNKAISIKPEFAEAYNNMGIALKELEMLDEAVTSYNKAISIKPDYAEAHSGLGNVLKVHGKLDEAVASYNKALTIEPDYAEAHSNLGVTLQALGRLDEAVASCSKALNIKPDFVEAHSNLGYALQELGRLGEAAASYKKALATKPDYAEVHSNLGNTLQGLGQLDEALASYNKALNIEPGLAEAHNNQGNTLQSLGQLDGALASYNKALAIKPDYAEAHSNILLTNQYGLGQNIENLYKLHKDWDEKHAQRLRKVWLPHLNTPNPDRLLNIGFVSPDLGRHPVGYFLISLFENILKTEINLIVYSDRIADDLTDRFKVVSSLWRDVKGISNDRLSEIILEDEVDILFDLTGHSAGNRLLLFARKPAPIQVSWAGYVGTTGLSSMDYLLSDINYNAVSEVIYFCEKIIRMPDGWLCYDPPNYALEVAPPPFTQNGNVTFCSFSNPAKINEDVISVWARIMNQVVNSRLLIKYRGIDSTKNINRMITKFVSLGIDKSRLILEGHSPHIELLARYNDVDIALDPFPYSGGLTTFEALWMGVPVITVPGKTFAGRHSLSHLSTIGLPELVAKNTDDYVRLAVDLADDPEKIIKLRAGLRSRMASSSICDGKTFARNFTAIMQKIWCEWCLVQDSH